MIQPVCVRAWFITHQAAGASASGVNAEELREILSQLRRAELKWTERAETLCRLQVSGWVGGWVGAGCEGPAGPYLLIFIHTPATL